MYILKCKNGEYLCNGEVEWSDETDDCILDTSTDKSLAVKLATPTDAHNFKLKMVTDEQMPMEVFEQLGLEEYLDFGRVVQGVEVSPLIIGSKVCLTVGKEKVELTAFEVKKLVCQLRSMAYRARDKF